MAYSAEVMARARARLAQAKEDRESENRQHLAEAYARVPRIREIDMLLRRTMAHVLFSYNEGLPMAILETMGCGIVNIATCIAAIPEVITDRETGFLVEPGDKNKLAEVLMEVSNNASERSRISANSFDFIAKAFSLEAGIRRLEQIYLEL